MLIGARAASHSTRITIVNWWIATIGMVVILAVIAGMRVDKVRDRVIEWYRTLRRTLHELSLLAAVSFAVVGGVGIVLLATWILRFLIHTSTKDADPIDITKLSFTVAAGVGAAVALVVAYRRQRDVEQGRFVERFGAAAAQLGDHDVAVRIAGVYAMAGVADESAGQRRQQCIDVLCGYLRLPYSPDLGSNHQTKLVVTEPPGTSPDGTPIGQRERHLEFRQNDKEVRATIVRVIADHLRDHEYRWSAYDFDFRTAYLEDVSFEGATFEGTTRFDTASFFGTAVFDGASFSGPAGFNETTFFDEAWFDRTRFSCNATFGKATFTKIARFSRATFSDEASFAEATFFGEALFAQATFSGNAWFAQASFSRDAWFRTTKFSGTAWFGSATFSREADFDNAKFSKVAQFQDSEFSGPAKFGEAMFSGQTTFIATKFCGEAWFTETDFGSEAISFDDPRQWGPPPPVFDWDDDSSAKPHNVTPKSWPPAPVP
ncbi:pentapeptide repeat-containing protein [Mycolicibacterium llatzerense]|uniref:pentapeptide repeat-containing protein n=1 Tax=Mycolicibacterium llatzerense TaxID=280871 RepID=UPI0031D44FB1